MFTFPFVNASALTAISTPTPVWRISSERLLTRSAARISDWSTRLPSRRLRTLFLGGGTPTLLDAPLLEQLFTTIHEHFQLTTDCEITSETNPGTVDREKFSVLRGLGVDRLSIGAQSFHNDELTFLGRIHSADEIVDAFDAARNAGFENISLDLMFGLPGQSALRWRQSIQRALALKPEHLSLYSLIVERNTPLFHWVESGRVAPANEDSGRRSLRNRDRDAGHSRLSSLRSIKLGTDHADG